MIILLGIDCILEIKVHFIFFFFSHSLKIKKFIIPIYLSEHDNFLSIDNDGDPFVLSILREVDMRSDEKFYQYRVIVWLKIVIFFFFTFALLIDYKF